MWGSRPACPYFASSPANADRVSFWAGRRSRPRSPEPRRLAPAKIEVGGSRVSPCQAKPSVQLREFGLRRHDLNLDRVADRKFPLDAAGDADGVFAGRQAGNEVAIQ